VEYEVRNAKGELIKLTPREALIANYWQRHIKNALGYDIQITTLTTIVKKVSEQKFYEIPPADYMPIVVGNGAWSDQLTTYRSYNMADSFETGIINTGTNNARMANADAGVDSLTIKVFNWAKAVGWSIFDLELAAKSGNWDLIAAKEESRKKNWDLGIQRIAFLGASGVNSSSGSCLGLLNQPTVTRDTLTITQAISSYTFTQLNAFVQKVVEAYRANAQRTVYPTHFIIPESDYNGLNVFSNPEFPLKTSMEVLETMFKTACKNPNFKILPNIYGQVSYAGAGILPSQFATQMYVLLNYDEKSVRMDVPVPYTNTLANTLDGFNFQNAAYGQFTGVLAYRPLEMYYMGF
jgi:hypothetical protein